MTAVATWSSKMCSFGLKGTADPLLCQDPRTVLPSYASLMDTEASNDFSDSEVMTSNRLYSLYLLRGDTSSASISTKSGPGKGVGADKSVVKSESNVSLKEPVNGELHNGINGRDALFEGMPFFELRTKEVGPCAYCNMWSPVRYMSYCGNFPFCSVYCTKKFAVYKRDLGELSEMPSTHLDLKGKMKVPTLFENNKPKPLFPSNQQSTPPKAKSVIPKVLQTKSNCPSDTSPPFDWSGYLESEDAEAAPVRCFKYAPLNMEWKSSLMGAMLEVQTRDNSDPPNTFWVARIIQIAGYRARLRFEGYGIDSSRDFWIHLCTTESFPINGAVRAGKNLKPPKDVMDRLGDSWLEHISKVAHAGSLTISVPIDKVKQGLSCPFKIGMKLEAVYKRQLSHTCVARVTNVVADRIHVQYENCKEPSKDFWFHHSSSWIHPVGWSQRVGHRIIASAAFKSEALDKGRHKKAGLGDAPWEIFNMPSSIENHGFAVGMKMEVVDPLKLGNICAATVMEVLEEGYLMIAIDGCMEDKSSWFCYHVTSPLLLPVGFCEHHKIPIVPPRGFENKFDWVDYLKETQSIAAPVELFNQDIKDRGFRPGQKIEAVDLIEPGLICVATIVKIAGPLLCVHFDGWENSFDQWTDCESSNIYPVGWCEMVGYPLQSPKIPENLSPPSGDPNKSFKKRSRHSSSSEKKRKLESGGKLSAAGLQCKLAGNKKLKEKFPAKKKITPDVYWKKTGQDRVPSLDELERIPGINPVRKNVPVKVESVKPGGSVDSVYSFGSSKEDFYSGVKNFKSPKITQGTLPAGALITKDKKKRLKKSKKDKRDKKREKRKKEKKKSKDKSHRKKNKHKQNGLGNIDILKRMGKVSNGEKRDLKNVKVTSANNLVSAEKPLDREKVTPKLEPPKLSVSKEVRNSNVYFVSETSRPKFESMFGDRQGFVFEKKKVCATKKKNIPKNLADLEEHDPYSLEAEFPSAERKDTVNLERDPLKAKSLQDTLQDVLKGKYALSSIKVTKDVEKNSQDSISRGKNAPIGAKPVTSVTSTSPLSANAVVMTPTSLPSVLDSPISLSSTQSTSSTGNIPASSKSDGSTASQLSPAHQKMDLGFLPTPSSCGEETGTEDASSQPRGTPKEEQAFNDGDVDDLMTIIENDLASYPSENFTVSKSNATNEVVIKTTPEKTQAEKDADQKVDEILRAIRESSGHSTLATPVVKQEPQERQKNGNASPSRKKPRNRSKSLDKPSSSKKAAKARKSHLASLLQRPAQLNLSSGEAPFYLDSNFSPGNTPIGMPQDGPITPSSTHPVESHLQRIDPESAKKSSLLVEMLNSIASQQNKLPTAFPQTKLGGTKAQPPSFEATHLKRPNNLPFPPGPMSPPSYPSVSPGNPAAVLMDLVRPAAPKAVVSNPQSPVVSSQFNVNGSMIAPGRNFPSPLQFDPMRFPHQPTPINQVQQPSPTVPNQRLSPWINQEQFASGTNSIPQPVTPQSMNSPMSSKIPFRFPSRFQAPSPVSTPQRLPTMQTLFRGLQGSLLPKSPPSPAVPVSPLSPQIAQVVSSPYQLPPVSSFPKPFMQHPPDLPSPQKMLSNPQSQYLSQISDGSVKPARSPSQPMQEETNTVPVNTVKISNPWYWGVAEVMQFLYDAGEGGCADTFYRQQINGQKLMSLNKEQIAKLTGMKVASSLKIYQQVSKLQSMFPTPRGTPGINS